MHTVVCASFSPPAAPMFILMRYERNFSNAMISTYFDPYKLINVTLVWRVIFGPVIYGFKENESYKTFL